MMQRFRKDSRNEDGSGRPSISRTDVNVARVEELVLTHSKTVEKERKNPIYNKTKFLKLVTSWYTFLNILGAIF
jgi:hypothetical protein